jgi:hypothetical protein
MRVGLDPIRFFTTKHTKNTKGKAEGKRLLHGSEFGLGRLKTERRTLKAGKLCAYRFPLHP